MLLHLLRAEAAVLTASQRPRTQTRAGHLGGFDVTIVNERLLGSAQIVLALDGAPGTEIRMIPQDLADTDPAGLAIRLENRLAGLEALKTKTIDEIERLRTEAARARE